MFKKNFITDIAYESGNTFEIKFNDREVEMVDTEGSLFDSSQSEYSY